MKHDYLDTSIWYRAQIDDPYPLIEDLFGAADLASHRRTIQRVIQAACTSRIWQKDNPGDLLYFFTLYESLINAAYLIHLEDRKSRLLINKNDVFQLNLFTGAHANSAGWDCFPRCLSFSEFMHPYLVFHRFFKFMPIAEWKQELRYLLDYALTRPSLFEAGLDMDILSIYRQLTKLIEAAHLILVREIHPNQP